MVTLSKEVRPIQNVGLVDRLLRVGGGALIVGTLVLYYAMQHRWLPFSVMVYATAISVYPILTGLIGWDPFYALSGIRSCNDTGTNQCGTLPYQVKALLGRAPRYCDSADERSLEACHDTPGESPHHPSWRVDQEPMIYPDDRTLDEYVKSHPAGTKGAGPTAAGRRRSPDKAA